MRHKYHTIMLHVLCPVILPILPCGLTLAWIPVQLQLVIAWARPVQTQTTAGGNGNCWPCRPDLLVKTKRALVTQPSNCKSLRSSIHSFGQLGFNHRVARPNSTHCSLVAKKETGQLLLKLLPWPEHLHQDRFRSVPQHAQVQPLLPMI